MTSHGGDDERISARRPNLQENLGDDGDEVRDPTAAHSDGNAASWNYPMPDLGEFRSDCGSQMEGGTGQKILAQTEHSWQITVHHSGLIEKPTLNICNAISSALSLARAHGHDVVPEGCGGPDQSTRDRTTESGLVVGARESLTCVCR